MKNHRYQYLDSSRGIAAFCVLLHHFICAFVGMPQTSGIAGAFSFIWDGTSPVVYFFVLSGFVLSASYFGTEKNIHQLDYKQYFIHRIFRIYPLFLACLLISFTCSSYQNWSGHLSARLPANEYLSHIWTTNKSFGDLLKEAVLIVRIPSHSSLRLLPQDWTLTIEIIMSLMIPVLVITLKKSLFWFLVIFAVIFNYDAYILPSAAGVMLARFKDDFIYAYNRFSPVFKTLLILCAFFFYSAGFNLISNITENHFTVRMLLQAIGAVMLLGIIISSEFSKKVLSTRFLVYAGKISYGIYLTHFFVIIFALPYFITFISSIGINNSALSISLSFLFLMVVTLLLSSLLFKVIEVPFIKAGKQLSQVINRRGKFRVIFINILLKDYLIPVQKKG